MEEKEDAEARQDRGWGGHLRCVQRDWYGYYHVEMSSDFALLSRQIEITKGCSLALGKKYEHITSIIYLVGSDDGQTTGAAKANANAKAK